MNRPNRIHITTGDLDGIGLEVTKKALQKISIPKNIEIVVWCKKKFKANHKNIVFRESDESPAHWVVFATKEILKEGGTLVTGPLSKELIIKSGIKAIGHTEILAKLTGRKNLKMFFYGSEFSVLLGTGHLSLKKVSTKISSAKYIKTCLVSAEEALQYLPANQRSKPIGVVGVDPHAGEKGIIGNIDLKIEKTIKKLNKKNFKGPLVPDVAFQKKYWNQYSLYLSFYHDQGLIPFKMIHGQDSGVHITIGLPFRRYSVDHGTAKDIFNKNKANPKSMAIAIQLAMESFK